VTTVSVIAKGDPCVYILRYKSNEQKLYSSYQIAVSAVEPKEGNDISDYPYEVKLSKYGLLAAIAQYNGSLSIYSIPELKHTEEVESTKKVGSNPPNGLVKQVII
jgi:hypothetical protein